MILITQGTVNARSMTGGTGPSMTGSSGGAGLAGYGGTGSYSFGPAPWHYGSTTGEDSFSPVPGYYGGMSRGYQSYVQEPSGSFQASHYGLAGQDIYNYYMPQSFGALSQNKYAGPGAGFSARTAPAAQLPGAMSLQARGIVPGTCMWDCTAPYTPTECQQMCNQ